MDVVIEIELATQKSKTFLTRYKLSEQDYNNYINGLTENFTPIESSVFDFGEMETNGCGSILITNVSCAEIANIQSSYWQDFWWYNCYMAGNTPGTIIFQNIEVIPCPVLDPNNPDNGGGNEDDDGTYNPPSNNPSIPDQGGNEGDNNNPTQPNPPTPPTPTTPSMNKYVSKIYSLFGEENLTFEEKLLLNNAWENYFLLQIIQIKLDSPEIETIWEAIDEIIIEDSFENEPCLINIYETAAETSKTYHNYLKHFNGSIAYLRLSASTIANDSSLDSFTNAYTSPPNLNNIVNIVFNIDNLNRPRLDVFRTFIHELIHATIYRWMLIAAQTGHISASNMNQDQLINYINNLQNDFPGIYEYYYEIKYPDWGHEQMAAHFIPIIKQALSEFDNNAHSDDFYEALAWIGLQGYENEEGEFVSTISWNNLPQEDKDEYNQTYEDFMNDDENYPDCQ